MAIYIEPPPIFTGWKAPGGEWNNFNLSSISGSLTDRQKQFISDWGDNLPRSIIRYKYECVDPSDIINKLRKHYGAISVPVGMRHSGKQKLS